PEREPGAEEQDEVADQVNVDESHSVKVEFGTRARTLARIPNSEFQISVVSSPPARRGDSSGAFPRGCCRTSAAPPRSSPSASDRPLPRGSPDTPSPHSRADRRAPGCTPPP